MSRNQRYPRQAAQRRRPAPKENCSRGWHCKDLLKNHCEYSHDKDDRRIADKLNKLFDYKDTIVILDAACPRLTPICLKDPSLPITIINREEIRLDVKKYFMATLLNQQRPYDITLKIEKQLGEFGDWHVELKILMDYFPKEYQLEKSEKQTKNGEIKINGQLKKVITGHQGKKYYFQQVNKDCRYPLLKGCKVSYFEKGRDAQLTKINYPHQIKLCGILQIDSNSQFYFVSRNQEYDDMNPNAIPLQLADQLVEFKEIFPYSFLRADPISSEKKDKINKILREYLVKGRFKGWPHHSRYPIIELIDQISIKNFKSLKDGIIYEAGISMTPFDRRQKEDSQKLVKRFKIQDYQENRQLYDKQIYTVDGKSTKCHDDALYIKPLQNGAYFVEIHIADVAALIRSEDDLNKKLKKRDQTIYIKNYYQPMLYDCLKNLLSLRQRQQKLAFTLGFQVNGDGFIDYKTVKFHKNIIVVQKNLSHEHLDSGIETYPELMKLNRLFDKSKLIDSNYILESETKSQVAVSRLIFISSIIPTYMLQVNMERAKLFKESFEVYLKKMIEDRKKDMENWESILDKIELYYKEESKFNKQMKSIQKKIDNELSKERELIIKRLKDQQKDIKSKQQRQKKPKKPKTDKADKSRKGESDSQFQLQTEGQQAQLDELVIQLAEDVKKQQQIEVQEEKDIENKLQKQIKLKQKRAKALKQVNMSDLQSSQSQTQEQESLSSGDELQDQQFRFNAAVNGQRFLQRIFKNPMFNIDIKWLSLDQINGAFKTILSKDKGKLYQEYFKRLQIMNRQHFKYIIKMQRDKRKQKEIDRKASERTNNNESYDIDKRGGQEDKRRRKFKRVDQVEQPIKVDKIKQQTSYAKVQTKIQTHQQNNQLEKKQPREYQQDTNKQRQKEPQRNTNKQRQNKPKRQRRQRKPPKENKQKQKKQIKKQEKKDEQKQEMKAEKKQENKQKQQKQQMQQDQIHEIDQDQKSISKKESNSRSANGKYDINLNQLVRAVKTYMENDRDKYIEKYQQQFSHDRKLSNLNMSLNKKDQQIKKKFDENEIKSEKIKRLKVILRQNQKNKAKTEKNSLINQKKAKKQDKINREQQKGKKEPNGIEIEIFQKVRIKVEQKQEYYMNKYQQTFCSNQKLEFSQDQQWQEEALQIKSIYKNAKHRYVLKLLLKRKNKQKKKDQVENQDKQKKEAKKETKKEARKRNRNKDEDKLQKNVQKKQTINQPNQRQEHYLPQDEKETNPDLSKQKQKKEIVLPKAQSVFLQQLKQGQSKNQQQKSKVKEDQPQKNEESNAVKVKKLSKKALMKKIQQQLKPKQQLIKEKYQQQKQSFKKKIEQVKEKIKMQRQTLYNQLETANQEYNLLQLMTQEEQTKKKSKKEKKQRKKADKNNKKQQKDHKSSILTQFMDNFKDYAHSADFKFKKMKISQLDAYLERILKIQKICEDSNDAIGIVNKEASKKGEKEQELLKWNNPIRSYESLTVMRLIKQYKWLFEGQIYPSDIIRYYGDIKHIEKNLKELEQYRTQKMEKGQLKKSVKEANRQISKLEFYNILKRDQNATFTFLNIGSPCPEKVKFVFHQILEDIEVDNIEFKQEIYKQVKGKVKIVRDFPLKLRVIIGK